MEKTTDIIFPVRHKARIQFSGSSYHKRLAIILISKERTKFLASEDCWIISMKCYNLVNTLLCIIIVTHTITHWHVSSLLQHCSFNQELRSAVTVTYYFIWTNIPLYSRLYKYQHYRLLVYLMSWISRTTKLTPFFDRHITFTPSYTELESETQSLRQAL